MKNKPTSLKDWTYDFLKEKILNLELKPGEQIHIDVFKEKLEISSTPIREAFLKLASENLVDVRPRIGYFVTEITEQNIRDIFEIRAIIETRGALNSIDDISENDLESLRRLLSNCKKKIEDGKVHQFVDVDIEFHSFIQSQIKNEYLSDFIKSMNDIAYRIRVASLQSKENIVLSVVEHEKILLSLIERDSEKVVLHINDHLEKARDRIINILGEEDKTIISIVRP